MERLRRWLSESNSYSDCSVIILYISALIELFLLFLSAMGSIHDRKITSTFDLDKPKYVIYSMTAICTALFACIYIKMKLTVLKCLSLLLLYISFRQEQPLIYIKIIGAIVSILCILIVELQNVDTSFNSRYFYNEKTRKCGLINNLSMAMLIVIPKMCSHVQWTIWLTCSLNVFLLFLRFISPYHKEIVQNSYLFALSSIISGLLCQVRQPQLQWRIVIVIMCIFGAASILLHQILYRLRQPWNSQLKEDSAQIHLHFLMIQLKKPSISQDMKQYLEKMANYARFKFPNVKVPPDNLSFYNKIQWINFVFELALLQQCDQPSNSYIFNKFILYYTIKKQWGQSVKILMQLINLHSKMSTFKKITSGFILSIQLLYYRSCLQSWLDEQCKVPLIPFDELNETNRVMQNMILIANSFKQLWLTLQEKQLFMNEIIPKVNRIQQLIEALNKDVGRLPFRSHYLKDSLVLFQTTIRQSPKTAAEICKNINYALELPYLNHDISQIVPMTVSLNENRVGEILQLGVNSAILGLNSKDNLNIQLLIPDTLKETHQKQMVDYIRQGTDANKLTNKKTVVAVNQILQLAQVNFKILLHSDSVVAYGFVKTLKKNGVLLLVQQSTGRVQHCSQSALDCLFDGAMPRQQKTLYKLVVGIQQLHQQLTTQVEVYKQQLCQPIVYNLSVIKSIRLSTGDKTHLVQMTKCIVDDPIEPFRVMITGLLKNHKRQDYWTSLFASQNVRLVNFLNSREGAKQLKNGNILRSTATLTFMVLMMLSIIVIGSQYYTFYKYSMEARDRLIFLQEASLRKWYLDRILLKTNIVRLIKQGRLLQGVMDTNQITSMISVMETTKVRLSDHNSDIQTILSCFRMLLQYDRPDKLLSELVEDSQVAINSRRESGRKAAAQSLESILTQTTEQPAKLIGSIALVICILMSMSIFFLIFKVQRICCQVSEMVCQILMTLAPDELAMLVSKIDNFMDYSKAVQSKPLNLMSMRSATMRLKQQDMINTDDELVRMNPCQVKHSNQIQKKLYKNKISCNVAICIFLLLITLFFLSLQVVVMVFEMKYTNLMVLAKNDTPLISDAESIFTKIIQRYTYKLMNNQDFTDVNDTGYVQSWQYIAQLRTEALNSQQLADFAQYIAKIQYTNVSQYNPKIQNSNMILENMCSMMIRNLKVWKNVTDQQLLGVLVLQTVNYDILAKFNKIYYEGCNKIFLEVDEKYKVVGIGTLVMSMVLLICLSSYLIFVERKCVWQMNSLKVIKDDDGETNDQISQKYPSLQH